MKQVTHPAGGISWTFAAVSFLTILPDEKQESVDNKNNLLEL